MSGLPDLELDRTSRTVDNFVEYFYDRDVLGHEDTALTASGIPEAAGVSGMASWRH
jgi:hypothetical protein